MTQIDRDGHRLAGFSARMLRAHRVLLRRLWLGALVIMGIGCLGNAWADSLALMSGAGQTGLGGSQAQEPLVVSIRDASGAPVAGRTIDWSTSNGFVLGAASSVSDANGLASVTFIYGNPGTTAIVATDPVGATSTQAEETSVGMDSFTLISGSGQAGRSGSASAQPIVVQVLDASGHPIVGRTVDWADKTTFTHVNAATSVTDASGEASMGFTYVGGAVSAGGNTGTIQATNSTSPSESVLASETVVGFDSLTLLSGASQSGLVGSTSSPIVAQVLDDNGNPVPGVTVTWSQTSGTAGGVSLSSNSTVTDASGKASITFQYLLTASGTITAQSSVTPSQDAHFASVSAASLTLISPSGMSGAPGTPSRTPVVVEAHKADGTPAVGVTINWAVLGGNATVNAPTSTTDATGRASMGFTFGTNNSLLSIFDNADGTSVNDVPLLAVSPNGSLQLVSGENQSGTTGSPGAKPIVVRLLDPSGAPLVGHTISWNIYSGNSIGLGATTSTTDAKGEARVSFNYVQAGSGIVVASTDLVPVEDQQVFITETATGLFAISAASGADPSGLAGTRAAQPLVIKELDPAGKPVVGHIINWSSSGTTTLDGPTSTTNTLGQASMGYTYASTASTSQVTATDPLTVNSAGSVHFTVIAIGSSPINMISGNGETGAPGAPSSQPLVVEVRDASGKVVSGGVVNWARLSGDSVLKAPSSKTDSFGRASMDFTFGPSKATTTVFTATDPASGQQIQFTVTTTASQNQLVFVSGNSQSGFPGGADQQPIVAALLDSSGQPVPGQTLTWSVLSGPATLTSVTNTTNPSGQVQASFNFGTVPGASLVQVATTGPNPLLIQTTITTLANTAQTLTIVSGNGQVLLGLTPSAPLVVQLTNAGNVPVVGATISWTATHGTLKAATSITDSAGRASTTVTAADLTSLVTVRASTPQAAAPAVFTLDAGLAVLPGLTPPEQAVAGALDNACPALEALTNPTPAQQDLLARCKNLYAAGGIDPTATANALGQLVSDSAEVQVDAAENAMAAQVQNISLRLNALRSSSKSDSLASGISLSGLSITAPGGALPVGSLLDSLFNAAAGDDKKQIGSDFSRWGFFATGNVGTASIDARSETPAYNYNINGLTAGIDYRQRDNWVSGVAVGYSRQNTSLQDDTGHVQMTGWTLSSYSTWSFKNNLYLDGVLTWGNNSFDLTRRIDYTLPTLSGGTTSIDQLATGRPGGDLFMAALTFGGDFHKQAWNFSPYMQLISSRMGFDGYDETLLAGAGNGLGLAVNSRNISTFSSVLGTKVSYTHSTNWGVVIPTASLEWQHEYNSNTDGVTAHFINDPTQTAFTLIGDPLENSFIRLGVGASFVMPHGRSGFVLYEHTFGQDGLRQDNIGLGIRIEF